jgi:hypothetical protein
MSNTKKYKAQGLHKHTDLTLDEVDKSYRQSIFRQWYDWGLDRRDRSILINKLSMEDFKKQLKDIR